MFRNEAARFVHEEVRSKALGNDSPDEGSTSSILDVKNFSNPYRSQNWVERGERDTKVPLRKERKKKKISEKNVLDFGKMESPLPRKTRMEWSIGIKFRNLGERKLGREGVDGFGWDVNGGPRAREGGRGDDEGVQGVEQTSALSKGCLAVSDLTRRDYRRKRKNAYHLSTTNRTKIRVRTPLLALDTRVWVRK